MSNGTLFAVIALLILYSAWREYRHELERKDLYSRIMARDLPEYQAFDQDKRPPPKQRNFIRAGVERHLKQKLGDG